MGVYVCEFEFVEDGDMVLAWPFWPGYAAGTEGCGLEDAVAMAADWLRIMVLDCLAKGEAVPACGFGHEPERGGKVIAVAIEADLSEVPAMTAAEAARTLGISTRASRSSARQGSWTAGRSEARAWSARRASIRGWMRAPPLVARARIS
ncbi:MAG: hypothetical protein IKE22_08330 [Atopobiaceae bacterium]|nr:hypothetical protein [Atopobiaceae bacterium]